MARREQIVESARDLFLEGGLDGITMRAVAKRVGISATAIYRHFDDKDDLLRAVVDLGRDRFTSYLMRSLQGETPLDRLRLTGEAYLDFALDLPHDYQIMFLSWNRLRIGIHAPDAGGTPSPTLRFLFDRVRECLQGRETVEEQAVQAAAMLLWAQVHGLATLFVAGGGRELFPTEAFRTTARAQIRALLELWQRPKD